MKHRIPRDGALLWGFPIVGNELRQAPIGDVVEALAGFGVAVAGEAKDRIK